MSPTDRQDIQVLFLFAAWSLAMFVIGMRVHELHSTPAENPPAMPATEPAANSGAAATDEGVNEIRPIIPAGPGRAFHRVWIGEQTSAAEPRGLGPRMDQSIPTRRPGRVPGRQLWRSA